MSKKLNHSRNIDYYAKDISNSAYWSANKRKTKKKERKCQMTKRTAFEEYVLSECERQWNENQAKIYGLWKNQADDTKAEYYNDMYQLKKAETDNGFDICNWCIEMFEDSELYDTSLGKICFRCKKAIESRGEKI